MFLTRVRGVLCKPSQRRRAFLCGLEIFLSRYLSVYLFINLSVSYRDTWGGEKKKKNHTCFVLPIPLGDRLTLPQRGGGSWLGDTEQHAFGGKTTTKFSVNSSKPIHVPSGGRLREEKEDESGGFVLVCSTDPVFGCATWQGAVVKGRRVSQPGFSSSLPRFKVSEQLYYLGRLDPTTPGPCQERRAKNSPGKEGKPAPTSPSGAELRVPATKGSRAGT